MTIKIVSVLDEGRPYATILAQDEGAAAKMMIALAQTWEGQEDSAYQIDVESPDDFQDVLARLKKANGVDEEEDDGESEEKED
jgi:hypothetical protein